ncbi:MAG TPA: glycosyltransferase family 2 protein [Mycobacteriales bacterium]|jgi:cellulose synthase/poly-beta-1,6-N-acetylglucosamine synthase-like glycosyltransferase
MSSVLHVFASIGLWLLIALVLVGVVPLLAGTMQLVLVTLHGRRNHYAECEPIFPRTAVIVPAWNEAAVIGTTVDQLMRLEYPKDRIRIYVVDDGSTDETPEILAAKEAEYPGNVWPLRRENGGQGKAHTLNYGLDAVLADDWMQAVLIMDADVIYRPDSLRKMARHLADPHVGAVTAYIEEGSATGTYLTRFIGYEYITAQAAARRGQNVLGALACLAGGAQLHSRENLEALGGRIDTSSLAEDTFTTFNTQLGGRRVVFEPHAIVLAEEPATIGALWKQRLRWARGNVQVTSHYKHVWFRHAKGNGLGGTLFGLLWFSLFLQPLLMILASASLVVLFFVNHNVAWQAFHILWITSAACYLFITGFTLLIDPRTGRKTWRQAALFPGLISVLIMLYTLVPILFSRYIASGLRSIDLLPTGAAADAIVLFCYVWLCGCMVVAWLAKVIEADGRRPRIAAALVYVGGYGPLLCVMTFSAYVKQMRHAELVWDKTEKTGKVALTS